MTETTHLDTPIAMSSLMEKAIVIQGQIAEKEKQTAALLTELGRSLNIKSVWPEAFDNGSCTFSGKLAWDDKFLVQRHTFRCAWLKDGAGNKRYLSAEELAKLKPEAIIHPTFKQGE